jgi:SHS2 domain-containing protein
MKKYEQIDISGDVGLKIWGKTLEELFANASEGMFELITDTSGIKEEEKKGISLNSGSMEGLFVQWLNELVFLFDTYGFIGKKVLIDIHDNALAATVSGGTFNADVHESRLLIKAATYHGLSMKKVDSRWEAEVIFDI